MRNNEEDASFRAFYHLYSIIIHLLKIPPLPIPILISDSSPPIFASLLIGISLALILFGTITLLVGFLFIPLLLPFLFLFYFFNLLSFFSNFALSILCFYPVSAVSEFPCCGCCGLKFRRQLRVARFLPYHFKNLLLISVFIIVVEIFSVLNGNIVLKP